MVVFCVFALLYNMTGYQSASDPCDSLVGHGESDDQNAVIWSRDFRAEIGEIPGNESSELETRIW